MQIFTGIDKHFQEKINTYDSQNHIIIFNQKSDSLHLMIPILKESTEIERDFVEQNNGISTENVIFDDISAKKELPILQQQEENLVGLEM